MAFHNTLSSSRSKHSEKVTPKDLHEQYLGDVLRFVSSFVKPLADAEDVTMEVFHAAFEGIHKLKQIDDPKIWLLGIARRKVSDTLRRRDRRVETSIQDASDLPCVGSFDQVTLAMVNHTLLLLPEDQREAIVLKYAIGLTTMEIAQLMHRSEPATNSLLQRARASFYCHGASLFLADPEVDHV